MMGSATASGAFCNPADRAFSIPLTAGSAACVMADRLVRTRSARASSGSVMTGMLCGPATRGRRVSVGTWAGPLLTCCPAHLAVVWSWQTTRRAVGSRYFVHRYET